MRTSAGGPYLIIGIDPASRTTVSYRFSMEL